MKAEAQGTELQLRAALEAQAAEMAELKAQLAELKRIVKQ